MRVFIVCALVGAGYLYYILNQDTDRVDHLQPGASAAKIIAHCVAQKKQAISADTHASSVEETCAHENDLRYTDGGWTKR